MLQTPVVESLMVALAVVVLDVLPREAQVALTEWDHAIEDIPSLIDRTNRSAYALRLGLLGGSRMGWIPALVRMSATTLV